MTPTITGHTGLYCLLGHPAAHSISPTMQNLALQTCGLNDIYLAFDVTPEDLPRTVDGLRSIHAKGWNLTMPHKREMIPLLDEILPAGRLAGAVNTVINRDGRLIGTTTDGIGFLDSLREMNLNPSDETMTILGAGGAASAIIVQAALDGMKEMHIGKRKNQTYEETLLFAEQVSQDTDCDVTVFPLEDMEAMEDALSHSSLLVNGTNVGMGDDKESLVPKEFLREELFVSDIIYHPEKTTLLKDASAIGCRTMNGKYMLLYQGAASFELWTNHKMPVELVKEQCFS